MRLLRTFIVVLIFALPSGSMAQAEMTQFFESIQDLPLMPGLIERTDSTVVFDKPEGRIIESVAEMHSLSDSQVRAYYIGSLPQFGWKEAGRDVFIRGGEALELAFESMAGEDVLRVMVSPR